MGKDKKTPLTIQELEKIMREHGVVIRAIPMTVKGIYETCHQNKYPNGKIEYQEEYGREMLVVTSIPKNAGKFLIESVKSTTTSVWFHNRPFDSIEAAVQALITGEAKSPNYTTGVKVCSSKYTETT